MDGRTQYSNFKVRKETASALQEVKKAVQALNGGKEITNDELITELIKMAQKGNAAFNAVYQKVVKDGQDLLKLAEEENRKISCK